MGVLRQVADIFRDTPPFIIAEVGLLHDGSLGIAHAFIDAIARTGADAVKFQTHIAAAESTPQEPFRTAFSFADATRFDYWMRTAFNEEQWVGLKSHAEERGLVFLSSPFSLEAAQMLECLGVAAWKVGSGELGSQRMIEFMVATGKPLLLSSGMSSYSEMDAIAQHMATVAPDRHVLMQCTTEYPTSPENVGLNVLAEYQRRYKCPVGLSDHSGTPWPAVTASWMGARVIEVHATLSRDLFGPDVSSSLTMENLRALIEGVRFAYAMRRNPVNKDAIANDKATVRKIFGKSAVATRDLAVGETVQENVVAFLKPANGIAESNFAAYIGRKLRRNVAAGSFFSGQDFES